MLHCFSIVWRVAKQNAEDLVIPHAPKEAATQFLQLAEHMLRNMVKHDDPVVAKSEKLIQVRSETIIPAKHIVTKIRFQVDEKLPKKESCSSGNLNKHRSCKTVDKRFSFKPRRRILLKLWIG